VRVAALMRSAIALPTLETVDPVLLLRALEVYELDRLDFAEAYLVAQAELTGIRVVLSFDRSIDESIPSPAASDSRRPSARVAMHSRGASDRRDRVVD
jgi:hypothetical protein